MQSVMESIFFDGGIIKDRIIADRYKKASDKFYAAAKKLESALTEEQQKLWDDVYLLSGGLTTEENLDSFKEGVSFGMRIALEVFGLIKEEGNNE